MKYKKLKILEIIILITIITSILVILLFAKNALSQKPKISTSNEIKNYSVTKYYEYNENITKTNIYSYPLTNMDLSNSQYYIYLTSTDNIINTFTEKIIITYLPLTQQDEIILQNYCNTYDIIELEYKFQCTYKNRQLILKNTFYLEKIQNTPIIKNNIKIDIPIKKNTRLNEYLIYLTNNNYFPVEIESIK